MSPRILQEASPSTKPEHKSGGTLFYFLGGIVVLAIVLIFFYVLVLRKRIKRSPQGMTEQKEIRKHIESADMMKMIFSSNQQSGSKEFFSGNLRTINCFDYQTLKNATMNFHADNFLGSGGFGPVYKGKLADGRVIAVKKLSLNKSQQGEKEFLVEFQPKIGDFGLARFFPEDQAYLSTQFAGTLGYTAPEYAIRGELSEKADIYSFGVLLLEIICCRKNTDHTLASEMQYLPEYAWKLYENERILDIVDPKLREHGLVEKDVMQAIHVAFLCLQPDAHLRPPMSEIVALLTFKIEMVTTPMRPAFLDRGARNDDDDEKEHKGLTSPI
ncbi:serine/threonine-protein kinase PBS1 [Vigna unguiculata]|uniref:Serine/threonine-protein kinase PBS1 n=1 Tax=Vigna unguiculata TaxID=3917 RepID=A0A4D6NNT4_VIGUN|nr:serine/threonine-protein kinase PBS1 [Vigna unguiculata]